MSRTSRAVLLTALAGIPLLAGCSTPAVMIDPQTHTAIAAPPAKSETFRFVVLSDRTGGHIPGEFEKAISEISLLKPDFVINVGDLVEGYTDNQQELQDQWKEVDQAISRLGVPFFYCPGNHDVQSDEGSKAPGLSRQVYLQRHGASGRTYYSFDYQNSHFVVLDSIGADESVNFADEQFTWLQQDMQQAAKAEHIFVFYHYPLWQHKTLWPRLTAILPHDKTTIFNGHWHDITYNLADGIPTYALSSTAAGTSEDGAQSFGNYRMFAYVAVQRGEPSIALVPVGQIRPASYAADLNGIRESLKEADGGAASTTDGTMILTTHNPGPAVMAVDYEWLAPEWSIKPLTQSVTLRPGASEQTQFEFKPATTQPSNPVLVRRYHLPGGYTADMKQTLPIIRTGTLGTLSSIQIDGSLDDWKDIPSSELTTLNYLYDNTSQWHGPTDSSCRFQVARSGDNLAIAIDVTDDQLVNDQKNFWENDCIEICWDVRPPEARRVAHTEGSGQLAIVPGSADGQPKQVVWIPAGKESKAPANLQSSVRRTTHGYSIELLVPIADLGLNGGTLRTIGTLGLCIDLDDRDGTGPTSIEKRLSITGTGDYWRSTAGYAQFTPAK